MFVDRRGCKSACGNEETSCSIAIEDADKVLCGVSGSKRVIPPLHLDQVEIAIKFNRSVNLFDDAELINFARECFSYKNVKGSK